MKKVFGAPYLLFILIEGYALAFLDQITFQRRKRWYPLNNCLLNSLTLSKSKIWNSNKWIKINAFGNFEKIINELED